MNHTSSLNNQNFLKVMKKFLIINKKFQIDYNVFNKILFIIINICNYKVIQFIYY